MLCDKCGCELQIMGSHREVTGDNSPGTPTIVYDVLELFCKNPQCERFQRADPVKEVRNIVYDGRTAHEF